MFFNGLSLPLIITNHRFNRWFVIVSVFLRGIRGVKTLTIGFVHTNPLLAKTNATLYLLFIIPYSYEIVR